MKAVSIKIIDLSPMNANEAYYKGYRIGGEEDYFNNKEGYEVTYEDGYKSWCPKEVVEKSYLIYDDTKELSLEFFKTKVREFLNIILNKLK